MSWTTGTQMEALSSSVAVGTALASSSSAALISPVSGAGYLPANFFLPTYGPSKSVLVKAYGVLSTTSTPTLTIGVAMDTTLTTYNSSGVIAVTAATTMGSGVSNVPWSFEALISCVTTGASGTFLSYGTFIVGTTALIMARVSSSTANPNTAFTLDTRSAYYPELVATWSAASASNTIQCYQMSTWGLN